MDETSDPPSIPEQSELPVTLSTADVDSEAVEESNDVLDNLGTSEDVETKPDPEPAAEDVSHDSNRKVDSPMEVDETNSNDGKDDGDTFSPNLDVIPEQSESQTETIDNPPLEEPTPVKEESENVDIVLKDELKDESKDEPKDEGEPTVPEEQVEIKTPEEAEYKVESPHRPETDEKLEDSVNHNEKTNESELLDDIEMQNIDEDVDKEPVDEPMEQDEVDKSLEKSNLDPFDQVKHADKADDDASHSVADSASIVDHNDDSMNDHDRSDQAVELDENSADLEESSKEADTEREGDQEAEHEGDHEADQEVDHEVDHEGDHEAEVEGDQEAEVEGDQEPEVEGDHEAEVEVDQEADAEIDQEAEVEVDQEAEAEVDQDVEAEAMEPEVEPEVEAEQEVEAEPETEAETAQEDSVVEEGVDEITEGEGVDEDVCLLPDDERVISDADKEAALAAREAAEIVSTDAETTENQATDQTDQAEETLVDLTEAETAEKENETHDEVHDTASDAPPKVNEIREVIQKTEQTCLKCSNTTICEYNLIEENDAFKYICTFDCVQSIRNESPEKYILIQKKVSINQVVDSEQMCVKCKDKKTCKYRYRQDDKYSYLCDMKCVEYYTLTNGEKYFVKRKRYLIDEATPTEVLHNCLQCSENKMCKYCFKQEEDELFICHEDCLNLLMTEQPDIFRLKRRSVRVRDLPKRFPVEPIEPVENNKIVARTEEEAAHARLDREASFIRRCSQCFSVVHITDKTLQWETLDFCNEKCLGVYQNTVGSNCSTCNNAVSVTSLGKYCVRFGFEVKQFCRSSCLDQYKKNLKVCSYCQRDITEGQLGFLAPVGDKGLFKDFCTQACLKKYEEVLNPKKRQTLHTCAVCNNEKISKIEIALDGRDHYFCSTPCFSAFKFVNNVSPDQCSMCQNYFERKSNEPFTIYCPDKGPEGFCFCTKVCMNLYIITNRKIVSCNWCKVKKYNFDMIQKVLGNMAMCSLNCLTLCEVSVNALSMKQIHCDHCKMLKTPQYHLTMSDASVRNFCTYQCVMSFQSQFNKTPLTIDTEEARNSPVPAGLPKRVKKSAAPVAPPPPAQPVIVPQKQYPPAPVQTKAKPKQRPTRNAAQHTTVPIISNVQSLAPQLAPRSTRSKGPAPRPIVPVPSASSPAAASKQLDLPELRISLEPLTNIPPSGRVQLSSPHYEPPERVATPPPPPPKIELKTQIVTIPPIPLQVNNASTMCKPIQQSKGVSCRPVQCSVECQTEDWLQRKIVIPIPVPIYVPTPMHMYSLPTPIPVPIPLPIPIPVFIPTTRNSAAGIMKEIKKIQEKMPTDPFEAELLMMAEMVAGDKKKCESDSDSDGEGAPPEEEPYNDGMENNTSFNEDLVQMALKMASNDFDDPPVDLESAMTANTITQQPTHHPQMMSDDDSQHNAMHHHQILMMEQQRQAAQMSARGRKRSAPPRSNNNNRAIQSPNKRIKRETMADPPSPEPPREPVEKPDANMCLKYTFGVNAWKQWVLTKNADLEKSTLRRKPFKSEILQLTADELNYSLCLFVKEVRKPNGTEYAPDTIYYLVLGIQQYLFENGRIDNIFTDPYYEKFTECLDEVAKKFSVLYNDSQYIVTRVEEEHLWECKQLGAHSPHVLLSTLMFFNTKHFNLVTVEEHMELSFSHIMKHWKRNPNQPGAAKVPGSRNVLLRFYPPQASLAANSRKKKVYEQQENEENPLRCPVKLYEFYLSKCPESVKTRNDVFYLQPERSCVPDSPVWYSTQALSQEALSKMLHRVKMVKEINIALLTS